MHVEALVARTTPWREHDLRVTLYTRELGRLTAVARGGRRASSRQAPALDPGSLIQCELVSAKAGPLITSAHRTASWHEMTSSSHRLVACSFFLEAIDAMIYDAQPDETLWRQLIGACSALDRCNHEEVGAVFREQQRRFIEVMGYRADAPDDICMQIAGRPLISLALLRRLEANLE